MTHTYSVTGMTCNGCAKKVRNLLSTIDGVENVQINLAQNEADVTMQHHVQTSVLQNALKDYTKYKLNEIKNSPSLETEGNWFQTYKPILLIFLYIIVITVFVALKSNLDVMQWMNIFMGAFFLVFSFFKMLDLKAFSESYASYDIIAKQWTGYGYVYAFVELFLGIAYITSFNPILTNAITFVVMIVSIIGVLQSILNKRKIKCACLGTVFNLPMSTVTIIEDLLMIIMSLVSLVILLK